MKLIVNPNDFERVKELSRYNHNIYKSRIVDNTPYAYGNQMVIYLLEVCDEASNTCELYEVDESGGNEMLLGCYSANDDGMEGNKPIEMGYKIMWT